MILAVQMCYATYYSQDKQDEFLNKNYFKNMRNGSFVEIGAHNGIKFSNTYFYEKELNWKGICIEPMPAVYGELIKNRMCVCVQGCVSDREGLSPFVCITSPDPIEDMFSGLMNKYDPRHWERIKSDLKTYGGTYEVIDVQCVLFNDLLAKHGFDSINYLSIDTEGGELEILMSIDFDRFKIDVITVEDNFFNEQPFISFLKSHNYSFVKRQGLDLVFVRNDLAL